MWGPEEGLDAVAAPSFKGSSPVVMCCRDSVRGQVCGAQTFSGNRGAGDDADFVPNARRQKPAMGRWATFHQDGGDAVIRVEVPQGGGEVGARVKEEGTGAERVIRRERPSEDHGAGLPSGDRPRIELWYVDDRSQAAYEDGIFPRAPGMAEEPRVRRRDGGSARPRQRSTRFAQVHESISGLGPLEHNKGAALVSNGLKAPQLMGNRTGNGGQRRSKNHLHSGGFQQGTATAIHAWVAVLPAHDDPPDPLRYQPICTGRSPSVVAAGLQGHVGSATSDCMPVGLPDRLERAHFSVRLAGPLVPALPEDAPFRHQHAAYPRIGFSPATPALRDFERTS